MSTYIKTTIYFLVAVVGEAADYVYVNWNLAMCTHVYALRSPILLQPKVCQLSSILYLQTERFNQVLDPTLQLHLFNILLLMRF